MLVFWWQGKGFFTALIVVGSAIVTGMIADAARLPSYSAGFWAVVFLVSAAINWIVGRRLNAKRRKTFGLLSWRAQLTYKARHKFMSLPMETGSVAMLILAVGLAISGLAAT